MKVICTKTDIYSFPSTLSPEESGETITIGDLHGNTMKLTYFLFRHGVIAFKNSVENPAKAYEAFVNAYEIAGEISECHVNCDLTIRCRDQDIKRHANDMVRYDELVAKADRTAAEETELRRMQPKSTVSQWLQEARDKRDVAKEIDANCRSKLPDVLAATHLFLRQLQVRRRNTLVRLIGDELADRGSNDWMTLLLLQYLSRERVEVVILISNHSQEFVSAFESYATQKKFEAKNDVVDEQKTSFVGLQLLLEEKLVSMHEVMHLVNSSYQPMLRILDYSLHPEGIRIYTHAPISLEVVRHVARVMRVSYDDSTREALAVVIDKINIRFARRVREYASDKVCDTSQVNAPNFMSEEEARAFPLANVIWNRWTDKHDIESARPLMVNGYQVNYVHGHDTHQSRFAHVTNLDTACGKGSRAKRRKDAKDALQILADPGSNERLKLSAQNFLDNHCVFKVACSDERALPNRHHKISIIEAEFRRAEKKKQKGKSPKKKNLIETFVDKFKNI